MFIKQLYFYLIFLLIPLSFNAQHQKLLDSLRPLSSYERSRVVHGYSEAEADYLNIKERRDVFFQQLKVFAETHKDPVFAKELDFMQRKQSTVMDFPKKEREAKLKQFIKNPKSQKDLYFLAFCYHELGQISFQNGDYVQAFENNLSALEVYDKIGYQNVPNIGKSLHEIALHYYFFKDYDEVIKLMNISLQFPAFSKGLDMQRYNNLGLSYTNLGEYNKALPFFLKGLSLAKQYKSDIWVGILSGNLGEMYYRQKNYKTSLHYFKKNFDYNNQQKLFNIVRMNSSSNMVKVYVKLDSVKKAKKFLEISEITFKKLDTMNVSYLKARHLGDRQQLENAKKKYFEVKIDYLKKVNDYQAVVVYQDSLMHISKGLENTYNDAVGKVASHKLATQKKETEKEAQQLLYILLIILIIIIGALSSILLYRAKQKKKLQNESLIEENIISHQERQETEEELALAKKDINHFLKKIDEHNKLIGQLEDQLSAAQLSGNAYKTETDDTLQKLKSMKILTDDNWFDFQRNFEKVYPAYVIAIKAYEVSMTASEIRFLMLTKLGFNNKEKARALGVSDAAIRMVWNRLHKKLNLSPKDTPTILLEKIKNNFHLS